MKVKYSSKALSDRKGFIESNISHGKDFAKKEDKRITEAAKLLAKNPGLGRDDLNERGLLYILPDRYKILYSIHEDCIKVDRVFF